MKQNREKSTNLNPRAQRMELDAFRMDLRSRAAVSPFASVIAAREGRDPAVMPALVELREGLVEERCVVDGCRGGKDRGACEEAEGEEEGGELHI